VVLRRPRIIPTLLIDSTGGLIKTIKFGKRTYIGDPINAVKIFNAKGVDELVLLDIDATKDRREPNFELVEEIVSEAFMPIGYGGGIANMDQIAKLFGCGLEKVIFSTAAQSQPKLIEKASQRYGAQSIVVCLDVKKTMLGGYKVMTHCGTSNSGVSPEIAAAQAVRHGAGEVVVYSIDRDGSYKGYDLVLLKLVANTIEIPVVACGGARNIEDFYLAITEAHCSAVAAGSMFVFQGSQRGMLISYPTEQELQSQLFDKI